MVSDVCLYAFNFLSTVCFNLIKFYIRDFSFDSFSLSSHRATIVVNKD